MDAANERERESDRRGPGFGLPPPETGSFLLNWIHRASVFFLHLERRSSASAPWSAHPTDAAATSFQVFAPARLD